MPIDDTMSNLVMAQLIHLESEDPDKDINLYVNSPGGDITSLFAIYDTMKYIKCDLSPLVMGQAASPAAVLVAAGTFRRCPRDAIGPTCGPHCSNLDGEPLAQAH